MYKPEAIKATYHYYFCQYVLAKAERAGHCTGDEFGIGEDTFITALYPLTEIIFNAVQENDVDGQWKESQIFALCDVLSSLFWIKLVDQSNEVADIDVADIDLAKFAVLVSETLSKAKFA